MHLRVAVLAVLLAALALPLLPMASGARHEVLLVDIEGVVGQGTAIHVSDALDEAQRRGVPLLLRLDTPGGLVDSTLDIHRMIERSSVPVLTYVGPRGGFAASAGTFILLMGHPAGMAPGTQIGSAQPIQVDPTGGSQNASSKVENFLVERMRAIAERTGRNPDTAERFITENLNMDEEEALASGMIDAVSPTAEAFLDAVHGRDAIVGDFVVVLDTKDARLVEFKPSLLARTVAILGEPQVAFVLFMVGLYALIFGLANPGTYVPETIGALFLLLGLIGFGLFNASTAGILLLLLAAGFLVAEVFTPTHGLLTTLGVVSFILAVVFLIREPLLPAGVVRQFYVVGITGALLSALAVGGAVWLAARAHKRPVSQDGVGETAIVAQRLGPAGKIALWGEYWNARSTQGDIDEGSTVRITGRKGLTYTVEPASPDDSEE